MNQSPLPLLAPTFLFRFSVPCYRVDTLFSKKEMELPARNIMPSFGELEDRPVFSDFRLGWNPDGFALSLRVMGKKTSAWCRTTRMEDSDGLRIWFDTRDTGNIHRASRFCHEFMLMPEGGGKEGKKPFGGLIEIQRAKENPKAVAPEQITIHAEKRIDGYLLRAGIPTSALTGFDPTEQQFLGFTYAIMDRELGWQTFTISNEFPFTSDPTLWGRLELVD